MKATGRMAAVVVAGVVGLLLAVVAPAFACAPNSELSASPNAGHVGSTVRVTARGFDSAGVTRPVEIRWNPSGRLLASQPGPTFTVTIAVPPAEPGDHFIVATQRDAQGGLHVQRVVPFLVEASPAPDPAPAVPPAPGYRLVASDGGVFAFGAAGFFGSMGGKPLNRPIVGMAATPSGKGYWQVASDGGIFAFGDAGFYGSMGGRPLARPIIGMTATPSGRGYWMVASDGGIFAFGDAGFRGSTGGTALSAPIVGMDRTASGAGYWLAGSDGGVFAFGDAGFLGSVRGLPQGRPITGIARSPGGGYWMVDAASYVFPFGELWAADVPFDRSVITHPIVGMRPTGTGRGHWLAATDGGVFAAYGAPFHGSMGGVRLAYPVVGITAARG